MSTDDSLGRPAGRPQFEPIRPDLDYPDLRTAQERAAEAPAAVSQSGAMTDAVTPHTALTPMFELLQRRQTSTGGIGQIDLFTGPQNGQQVMHVHGEILVRTDPPSGLHASFDAVAPDVEALDQFLADRGYHQVAHGWRALEAIRLYQSDAASDTVWEDVLQVRRDLRVPAGLHLVVPLGHVIKGVNYPTATTARRCYSPDWIRRFVSTRPFTVAVIDTGITPEERTDGWLTGIVKDGVTDPLDVFPDPGRLDLGAGHGTFTAGVIEQVAPAADIVMFRAANSDGVCTELELAAALRAAADSGAAIINVSMGTPTPDSLPPTVLEAAIEQIAFTFPETLIVASAGNDGMATPMWPAAFKQVVGVGALQDNMDPAPWSTNGFWVDCSAVGVGVASTFVPGLEPPTVGAEVGGVPVPDTTFGENSWALWSGTSFSAPQIAGAVARLCQQDPNLRPKAALQHLLAGQPFKPGYGRLIRLLPGTPTP